MIKGEEINYDRILFNGVNYSLNGLYKTIEIEGEVFELKEGSGAIITSKNGKTATIRTGHADALNYINKHIWT